MSTPLCCQSHSNFFRRALGISQWILPTAILALLPKCPACLAGYALLWTGIGLSMSAAAIVRSSLLFLSVAMLILLAAKQSTPLVSKLIRQTREKQR